MSTEPRFNHFLALGPHGFHRVAYTEWGNPHGLHLVVCVHGLTRNSRDFDELAASLADRGCRVACMDVVGRGESDWLEHKQDYGFSQYLSDAAALLARLTAPPKRVSLLRRLQGASEGPRIDWVGTSMGGLIGMMLAARRDSPIRRLVLNDVGPMVPWNALVRLKLAAMGSARDSRAWMRSSVICAIPAWTSDRSKTGSGVASPSTTPGAERTVPIRSPSTL